MAYVRIRPRRSTIEEWNYYNPILAEGEMGIEVPHTGVGTGVVKVKFGDGVTAWKDLPYGINLDVLEDKLDKLERNNSILSSEVDVVETKEIVPNETGVTDPGEGSGGGTETDPGTDNPTEPPTEPTDIYEQIEIIEITTDSTINLFKLTSSAVYAEITEVSDPFYRNSSGSFVIAEGVTADTFTEMVVEGLWVRSEYVDRFYPNVTAIYVKESDGSYTEVSIPTGGSIGSTPFIDTINTTSGEKYIKVSAP